MENKKVHFIGICGMGMSATAVLLKNLDWEVTGSDAGAYPPASDYLQKYGIDVIEGYAKENVPDDAELIVIGKNAKLTKESNEEVAHALDSGISVRSFPEVLGNLADEKERIVVAGSYGKSTSTALLSWCLMQANSDPSYFIGAQPLDFDETAHIGNGEQFIFEGDEYPASNWDDTSKFCFYHPHDILLTSAEHDHVNVFPTLEEYLFAFKTLTSMLPPDGILVACADEENAAGLAQTHPGKTITYGIDAEADWGAADIVFHDEKTTFTLTYSGKPVLSLETPLFGNHNVQNIVGVCALLLEKKLISENRLQRSIASFNGLKRRLDLLTPDASVSVYEGFGSSYRKAQAAISALRQKYNDKRLIVVFEPYEFSWRNRDTAYWYDDIFSSVDEAIIYKPSAQGADTQEQLTHDEIVSRIEQSGTTAHKIMSQEEGLDTARKIISNGDIILMMSSGTIGGLTQSLPEMINQEYTI